MTPGRPHLLLGLWLAIGALGAGAALAERSNDAAEAARGAALHNDAHFQHVIHISVDGMRPDAVTTLGARFAPNFYRLRVEGAFTDNARSDYDITVTLPNHACQLTGRPVYGPRGHGLDYNYDDGRTLADTHGSYVHGVFDVVHDHGFTTGMYAGKAKFALFDRTWNEPNGAPDPIGADNGRDKIDRYVYAESTAALADTFIADMGLEPFRYVFLHLRDLDSVGHESGWESNEYYFALMELDGMLGRIFDLVDHDPDLAGVTAIVLTADHGGLGTDHGDPALPADYTIPLYAWGPGIPAGADLYALNEENRIDPGAGRPTYLAEPQPIRNGEAANLSLDLLGLMAVPGSSIDAAQDLAVSLPGGAYALPAVSITSPADGADFVYPATVEVSATAVPGTGTIASVELFNGYIKIGEDFTAPYSWVLSGLPLGAHHLAVRANRSDGASSAVGVYIDVTSLTGVGGAEPGGIRPPRVFPNPIDRSASVEFTLPRRGAVDIDIYNLLGQRVKTVYHGTLGEGTHRLTAHTDHLAAGLYFLMLRSSGGVQADKIMVVR